MRERQSFRDLQRRMAEEAGLLGMTLLSDQVQGKHFPRVFLRGVGAMPEPALCRESEEREFPQFKVFRDFIQSYTGLFPADTTIADRSSHVAQYGGSKVTKLNK